MSNEYRVSWPEFAPLCAPWPADLAGYRTTTIHDACATRDLDFNGAIALVEQVHTALMAALAFAYGEVISTDAFLGR